MGNLIITPGQYRTRDGRKAVVVHIRADACERPAIGYVEDRGVHSWRLTGRWLENEEGEGALDIVEFWFGPRQMKVWLCLNGNGESTFQFYRPVNPNWRAVATAHIIEGQWAELGDAP